MLKKSIDWVCHSSPLARSMVVIERLKLGYVNWRQWLYGSSVEDYHDFSWVEGRKLILHIVNPSSHAGKFTHCNDHMNYEYQLYVCGELPTKAIHVPFHWIQVSLQGVDFENKEQNEMSGTQDLRRALYWSKAGRHFEGAACFYTKNAALVGLFMEEYNIDKVEYPEELLGVLIEAERRCSFPSNVDSATI
jgi:hypothetical protein